MEVDDDPAPPDQARGHLVAKVLRDEGVQPGLLGSRYEGTVPLCESDLHGSSLRSERQSYTRRPARTSDEVPRQNPVHPVDRIPQRRDGATRDDMATTKPFVYVVDD